MSPVIKSLPLRRLGSQGLMCSPQGLGCMGMTATPNPNEEENQAAISKALELGINMFDTAWSYQSFLVRKDAPNSCNEEILGRAIRNHGREKFIICTKFGLKFGPSGMQVDGSEATIRSQLADSLSRLGTDYIDLYYQQRMDTQTPIEETMRVLKSLVEEGKIRYIGLSECTPAELRRAHAVHPITAIQMEWSLQTRSIEAEVVPTARELGVGIVCYSPLGRGMLSATIDSRDQMDPNDFRLRNPRFSEANFETNRPKAPFHELAAEVGATPAQLALAWLHAQGDDVFPIPGTKSSTRIVENAGAVHIKLSPEQVRRVEETVPVGKGDRYEGMVHTFDSRI